MAIGEQLAALASRSPDAPVVAKLADELRSHPLMLALQALLPAAPDDTGAPFDRMMGDVLLESLSPAQRHFLGYLRERPAEEASHDDEFA